MAAAILRRLGALGSSSCSSSSSAGMAMSRTLDAWLTDPWYSDASRAFSVNIPTTAFKNASSEKASRSFCAFSSSGNAKEGILCRVAFGFVKNTKASRKFMAIR